MAVEAVELTRTLGDDLLLGQALLREARTEHDESGPEGSDARLAEAHAVFERAGDRRQVGRVLLTRAYLWLEAGELDAAEAEALRCIAICEELDHTIGRAIAQLVRMWVAFDGGRFDDARELLEPCLTIARDCGYQALLAYCVAGEAALDTAAGEDERAAIKLGALLDVSRSVGGEGARAVRARMGAMHTVLAGRLEPDRYAELVSQGRRMDLEQLAAQTR